MLPVSQRHVILEGLLSYTLYNISVAGLTKAGEEWNRTFVMIRTNAGGRCCDQSLSPTGIRHNLPSIILTISTIMTTFNITVIHYYHHHDHRIITTITPFHRHHLHHHYLPQSTIIPLGSSNMYHHHSHHVIHHHVKLIFLFNIAPTREPWELICSDVSSYTISLHWYRFTPDLTGSRLTGYFISYQAIEPPDPTMFNVTLESFKYNYVVENLKAYTNYTFELHVFNPWGRSNTSTVVCKTEEGSTEKISFFFLSLVL